MNVINDKLVENWKNVIFCEKDKHYRFLLKLQNNKVLYVADKGFETNLKRIDRLINEDMDLFRTYFEFPISEDYSYSSYNVMKAKSSIIPFHVQYTIDGKAINFRYSTSVYGERGKAKKDQVTIISFVFRGLLDISSKINKGDQVHYMIFATQNERYIVDYKKVRTLAETNHNSYRDLGSKDAMFTIQELISNNCINDIFILNRKNEEKVIKYTNKKSGESCTKNITEYVTLSYKTINEEKESNEEESEEDKEKNVKKVNNYKGNLAVKSYEIKATGKTMNETIIARIKNEKFSTTRKDGVIVYYESILAAHNDLKAFMKKDGYDYAYRGVVSQVAKFTKAFDEFKQTKKLPRVLPLLRIDLTFDFVVISKQTFSDPEFDNFIEAILQKKKAQRILRDKHSKVKSTLTIEEIAK